MDIDSDEPPSLVEVNGSHREEAPDSTCTTAQLKDLSLMKVPLTIVTGMSPKIELPLPNVYADQQHRLPRSRQDHASKLRPQSAARQANSSHPERLVHTTTPSPETLPPNQPFPF